MIDFSKAGSAVGAISATLEKARILAAYFRTLDDDNLRRAAVFMRAERSARRSGGHWDLAGRR